MKQNANGMIARAYTYHHTLYRILHTHYMRLLKTNYDILEHSMGNAIHFLMNMFLFYCNCCLLANLSRCSTCFCNECSPKRSNLNMKFDHQKRNKSRSDYKNLLIKKYLPNSGNVIIYNKVRDNICYQC